MERNYKYTMQMFGNLGWTIIVLVIVNLYVMTLMVSAPSFIGTSSMSRPRYRETRKSSSEERFNSRHASMLATSVSSNNLLSSEISQSSKDSQYDVQTENMSRSKEEAMKRLPSALIIGASKCGTRALLNYLALHPQVVVVESEVDFFNNDSLYRRGSEYYRELMPPSYSFQLTMEKSPDYFECVECPRRVSEMLKSAKLLVVLCDPVARLVSQYMQSMGNRRQQGMPVPSFEQWALDPASGKVLKDASHVQKGMYSRSLAAWYEYFPRDRIHVADGARLIKDPVVEIKKAESFLNLKNYLTSEDIYYNATRGFHCTYNRMLKLSKCLSPSKGRQHVKLSPDVNHTLTEFYEPYNQELLKNYQFTMSWT